MSVVKVIPCLDVAAGRVVKGINFVDLVDQGDPAELAAAYQAQGADELVFLDITATNEDRNTTLEMVQKTAKNIDIPFAVGGGVREVADAGRLFAAGAKKVGINSAAIATPDLINKIVAEHGPQSVVAAIDVQGNEQMPSGYEVVTHGGKKAAGLDAVAWAKEVVSRGAHEILLTSMDADGTKTGFDTDLLQKICQAVAVPVVASGGAGSLEHFVEAAKAGAQAVLAASVFHQGVFTVAEVKAALKQAGFTVQEA